MAADNTKKACNTITIDGIIFKTNGNIVFSDSDESPFYLARSPLLEKMDGYLENGMQTLLKKIKR